MAGSEDGSPTSSQTTTDMYLNVEQPAVSKMAPAPESADILGAIAEERQMVLRFDHINAYVSTQIEQPSLATQMQRAFSQQQRDLAPQDRQILHDIQGELQPYEVLAIMGPSGSGKTSLMSVISGRTPRRVRTSGKVTVNGQQFSKAMRRGVGMVLQDDLLYESLTVEETLSYAAALRLPDDVPAAEKMARVNSVLLALGLNKCRNTLIGGYFRRGVSGGERKRVSIGHELLINPSIILLDEPTSGLDSTTALHLITTLRQLAAGGRAIGTTIHQPSSRLYQQLDRLMLLAEGHVCYYGPANQVVSWFNQLGFEMPYGVNVADFILDLAMGEVPGTNGLAGPAAIRAVYRSYEKFAITADDGFHDSTQLAQLKLVEDAEADAGDAEAGAKGAKGGAFSGMSGMFSRLRSHGAAAASFGDAEAPVVVSSSSKAAGVATSGLGKAAEHVKHWGGLGNRGGASYSTQLLVLLSRCIKVRRFESLSVQKFLQMAVVAVVTGLFWWQRGREYTVQGAADTLGLLFFELLFPSFASLFAALFTFPNDYRMLLKERASGMYRVSAFYLARTASDLPLDLAYPSVFVLVIYFFGGLKLTALGFFANWLSLMLVILVAQSIGLLLGATWMNPKTAQTASTVLMLTFMLCGGYYVKSIPVWIAWVKYISFIYWGFNLLVKINFSGETYYECLPGAPCTPVTDLQKTLGLTTWPEDGVWPELLVLFGMLIAARVAVYVVLRVKTRPI